jgi:hypothetical protein
MNDWVTSLTRYKSWRIIWAQHIRFRVGSHGVEVSSAAAYTVCVYTPHIHAQSYSRLSVLCVVICRNPRGIALAASWMLTPWKHMGHYCHYPTSAFCTHSTRTRFLRFDYFLQQKPLYLAPDDPQISINRTLAVNMTIKRVVYAYVWSVFF